MEEGLHVHVPEDVLIEILSRLPVRSLLKYKCICKSWYALIKHPSFIHKHLLFNHATLNSNDASLIIVSESDCKTSVRKKEFSLISHQTLDQVSPFSAAFQSSKHYFDHIAGPCNGIYFLNDTKRGMFLCNPALRQLRPLPQVVPFHDNIDVSEIVIGFYFDFKTNDYKVLAIIRFFMWNNRMDQVFVYSQSSDSWRKLKTNWPAAADTQSSIGFQTHQNGLLHWLAEDENCDQVLFSFDIEKESFSLTSLPSQRYIVDIFAIFNETIAAVVEDWAVSKKMGFCCDIWVKKDCGGVEISWTKLFRIGPNFEISRVLGFRRNGEILMQKSVCGRMLKQLLVLYDPRSQEFKKNFPIIGKYSLQVITYMESLVSIMK